MFVSLSHTECVIFNVFISYLRRDMVVLLYRPHTDRQTDNTMHRSLHGSCISCMFLSGTCKISYNSDLFLCYSPQIIPNTYIISNTWIFSKITIPEHFYTLKHTSTLLYSQTYILSNTCVPSTTSIHSNTCVL